MRTFSRAAVLAGLAACWTSGHALAQDGVYVVNQNQTGVNLPGVVVPNGFDEVRAADGTTCRSAVSGSGAYLDSGVIGSGLNGENNSISAYGRLVVPLGAQMRRLDCRQLYQLELERLQLEVQMLKRGLDPRLSAGVSDAEWATDASWTRE
jgi:hypothetical protein